MTLNLHWSSVLTAAKCLQKYKLSYVDNLQKKAGKDSRAMILGSHVHAGIALALIDAFNGASPEHQLTAAIRGARMYAADNIKTNQTIYDWEKGEDVPDVGYQQMMADILIQAIAVLRYQYPRLGIGTRYRVASTDEVFEDHSDADPERGTPFVEWHFERQSSIYNGAMGLDSDGNFTVPLADTFILGGTVDAVLVDLQTKEYVIIDWKTRAVIPNLALVDLDGQLKLYAAVINAIANARVITQAIQWQLRSVVPKPVVLTEKTKEVSKANISTTWEVWSESVRAMGLDPEKWRDSMGPKMHPATDYTLAVASPITRASSSVVPQSILQYGQIIANAERTGAYPMIPSSMGCQFCSFKRICQTRINGGDVDFVIEKEFEQKTTDLDEIGEFDQVEA